MAFKPIAPDPTPPSDPEALFKDLRSRRVEGLLSHQADVIREYMREGLNHPDVALQMPTGSGKTLVGLLIGEWRRLSRSERVVFLCPTNQLVHQVVEQGREKFGLQLSAFTGSKGEYDPKDIGDFHGAATIAVTSYSALFNTSPFFTNAQVIILDDAHTSENYIASPWSLEVAKREFQPLFDSLSSVLSPLLSIAERARLQGDWRDPFERNWADVIPPVRLEPVIDDVVAILDSAVPDTRLMFAWQMIRAHLSACHVVVGTGRILFRPWIPPTSTHAPFDDATQRIYMSATLGECGDLERITGRSPIRRLSIPATYAKHGVGRRLFLFPERSLEETQVRALVEATVREAGRALYLVPDEVTANARRGEFSAGLGIPVFDARDIESSKAAFLSEERAVAVVANRYDGIDLAGDECRLLIVERLPRARNLLERFVIERMGAAPLLTERVTNRIVQAVGRCTRADTDYAIVIALGEELGAGLLQTDRRRLFHPEMQAELEFGVRQSKDADLEDFIGYITAFLEQGAEWGEADRSILQLRDRMERDEIPGAPDLAQVAAHEVGYQYAMWFEDWETAFDEARTIIGALTHESLRGYRALWHYMAGVAAWRRDGARPAADAGTAREYFRSAHKASPSVVWLRDLARKGADGEARAEADDGSDDLVVRMESILEGLGTQNNRKYDREELAIREGLTQNNSKLFEEAHARLGRLLGYEAGNREDTGSPDPWWIVNDALCLIFEDHSEGDPSGSLSVKKARQASSHPSWAANELPLAAGAEIVPVLISPVSRVDDAAKVHLTGVLHWPLDEFRRWADKAIGTVRELRKTFPGSGDIIWRGEAAAALRSKGLSPRKLIEHLRSKTPETLGLDS